MSFRVKLVTLGSVAVTDDGSGTPQATPLSATPLTAQQVFIQASSKNKAAVYLGDSTVTEASGLAVPVVDEKTFFNSGWEGTADNIDLSELYIIGRVDDEVRVAYFERA